MKHLSIISLGLLLVAGCANFDSSIEKKLLNDDYQRYTLSNGHIGVDIMPQLGGMISGFRYLPGERELFREQKITVDRDDLLPPFPVITDTGITDFLWGATTKGRIPTKIVQEINTPEKAAITMSDRFFRMLDCEWTKQVILKKNSSAFQVKMTFFNHSKKVINAAVWQNVIQSLGKDQKWDIIVMPCKGNIRFVGRRGVKFFTEDTVFQECDPNDREVFAVPGRPWIAARNELFPGVMTMRTTEELAGEGALFYTYKAMRNHTMEFIGKNIAIQPEKSAVVNLEYAFFPDMKNVSDIFGNGITQAVYAVIDGRKILIDWQSSGNIPAAEWEFFLTGRNGKKFSLGNISIPELKVSKLFSAAMQISDKIPAGKYRLSGISGKEKFEIIQPFTIK